MIGHLRRLQRNSRDQQEFDNHWTFYFCLNVNCHREFSNYSQIYEEARK